MYICLEVSLKMTNRACKWQHTYDWARDLRVRQAVFKSWLPHFLVMHLGQAIRSSLCFSLFICEMKVIIVFTSQARNLKKWDSLDRMNHFKACCPVSGKSILIVGRLDRACKFRCGSVSVPFLLFTVLTTTPTFALMSSSNGLEHLGGQLLLQPRPRVSGLNVLLDVKNSAWA